MPPFAGTDEERRVLAHYLASLWGFPPESQPIPSQEATR
jgi:mono/diheme cytochrome c family protein